MSVKPSLVSRTSAARIRLAIIWTPIYFIDVMYICLPPHAAAFGPEGVLQ